MLKPYDDTVNDVAFIGGRGLKKETFRGAFDTFEDIDGVDADDVVHMNQLSIMNREVDQPVSESGAS
jgi:hypothetical protein